MAEAEKVSHLAGSKWFAWRPLESICARFVPAIRCMAIAQGQRVRWIDGRRLRALRNGTRFSLIISACAMLTANAAYAQSDAEVVVDQLSDASTTGASAILLARKQEAAGDLTGAASTLERALISDEDADDVRLTYAALLCRLDDRQLAQQRLNEVSGRPSDHKGWAAVNDACGSRITAQSAVKEVSGTVSLGLAYEGDAFGYLRIQQTGLALRQEGLAVTVNTQLKAIAGLPSGYFFADGAIASVNSVSGPENSYQLGGLVLGYSVRRGRVEIAGGGVARHAVIGGVPYVTEYGGQAQIKVPTGGHGRFKLQAELVRQDYRLKSTYGGSMDGGHYELAASYEDHPSQRFQYIVEASVEYRSAPIDADSYKAFRLSAGLDIILDKHGTYIDLSSTVRFVDFGIYNTIHRRDTRIFNRLAVGANLGASGLIIEVSVRHNYRGYDQSMLFENYSNVGGELRLVWKFGRER